MEPPPLYTTKISRICPLTFLSEGAFAAQNWNEKCDRSPVSSSIFCRRAWFVETEFFWKYGSTLSVYRRYCILFLSILGWCFSCMWENSIIITSKIIVIIACRHGYNCSRTTRRQLIIITSIVTTLVHAWIQFVCDSYVCIHRKDATTCSFPVHLWSFVVSGQRLW